MSERHTTLYFAASSDTSIASYVFTTCEGNGPDPQLSVDHYYAKGGADHLRTSLIALASSLALLKQNPVLSEGHSLTVMVDELWLFDGLMRDHCTMKNLDGRNAWRAKPDHVDLWGEIDALSMDLCTRTGRVLEFGWAQNDSWIRNMTRGKADSALAAFHQFRGVDGMSLPDRPNPIWRLNEFGAAVRETTSGRTSSFVVVPSAWGAPKGADAEASGAARSLGLSTSGGPQLVRTTG